MSTTLDGAPSRPRVAEWQRFAAGGLVVAGIGFAAGFGVAAMRPAPATLIAGLAISEANLAGVTADLAIRMDRLAEVERSVAAHRGRLAETDALVRAGLALRDALRASGSYAGALATVLTLRGGEEALAPWRAELVARSGGVPDRVALAAELDAIAASVLALGDDGAAPWTARMVTWIGGLIRSDSRAAIQDRRRDVLTAARDAAARGSLAEAVAALDMLDPDAAAAMVDWVEAARRRVALDAMADRVAAAMAAYAYR